MEMRLGQPHREEEEMDPHGKIRVSVVGFLLGGAVVFSALFHLEQRAAFAFPDTFIALACAPLSNLPLPA
jgi:hypothetical protein